MLSLLLRTIRDRRLIDDGDRVLVAVSGGPDSMALLHALWEISARLRIELEVTTVDHGLRPESAREAQLVAERAEALGLRWHLTGVDVRGAGPARGGSLQDRARRLRLAALEELCRRRGMNKVALGHQADDQAETILFRILRGTGVAGLTGIPYHRPPFIRPLLDLPRAALLTYLGRRSIPYVDDPSNADLRFARARIRQRLLPVLEGENPRVGDALRALGRDAAVVMGAGRANGDDDSRALVGLAAAEGLTLSRRAAAAIARLASRGEGTRHVDVDGGRVEISYGKVSVHRKPPRAAADGGANDDEGNAREPILVTGPGVYALGGTLALEIRELGVAPSLDVEGATFDCERLPRPLRLRASRPGDRMRPRGAPGSRKLSDLLIDAKISRNHRRQLPLLTTADDTILFVPGLRPAECGRPGTYTRRWMRVTVARHGEGP
jgi:tRNA(Ile)-lysidine synthase